MVTCRLLVELECFKDAIKILDTIVLDNDEMPEAWYLLAFSYFNLKKYLNAKECCKNVRTQMIKLKMDKDTDPSILELKAGWEEVSKAIAKALGRKDLDSEDEQMKGGAGADDEAEDDGFETMSEEDISDDEDA